jgi:hypothetical protein
MLLGHILADGRPRNVDGLWVELLGLPDEVLEEVAVVLGEEQTLGLVDHLSHITDESLSLRGELLRRVRERLRLQEAVEGDVDLVILGPC